MIDLEAVEKVNGRYRQIRSAEWTNILDTWFALKSVAEAAERMKANYGESQLSPELNESLKALRGKEKA